MTPLPPTIDLLRHGKTESPDIFRGHVEDPLSEAGWLQMRQVTEGKCWDLVFTSPLGRCAGFAAELGQTLGISVQQEPGFAEYFFGDWDGEKYDAVMATQAAEVEAFFSDPFSHTPPNGEKFSDFHARVINAWSGVLSKHVGDRILIVTHGGVIMSILADLMGVDRLHGKLDVGYASLSRIRPGLDGAPCRLVSHGASESD